MAPDEANEVVVVYVTHDVYEAELLRNELRDQGISCEIDGESQGGFTELVESKLLVRAWDADRARKIIGRKAKDSFQPPRDEKS
jgi:hypothetical protein